MELNSEPRSFRSPVKLLDTVAEQLADVDLTLPDYCPDIEKILKCTLVPKIQTKSLSGGQLQVDGYCVVNVLYMESEKKAIRCCEQSVNFSQSFSLRETPENYVILTGTKPEYINCRAVSPRRLVMHGAFSLYAQVLGVTKTELYSPEEGLETLTRRMPVGSLQAFCQEQFTVSDEVSVADKPAIESILYSAVSAGITDAKAVTGKLMLNGELNLRLFYLTDVETGQTAKLEYILPFNQIIDCEGVEEQTRNLLGCEVMSYAVRLKNDIMSDKPAIALDVKLCLTEEGYALNEEEIVTDAYSVTCASSPAFENLRLTSEALPVADSFMEKLSVKVDSGKISKILDIYADAVSLETAAEENALRAKGKINLCMVALDENGTPMFVERSFDYAHALPSAEGCDQLRFGKARAAGMSFRLADDSTAEIRMELKITGGATKTEQVKAVKSVELFEDQPIVADDCALTLYFAKRDENLWNIAKAHNTRLNMLLSENALETLALDGPRMLLIPKL